MTSSPPPPPAAIWYCYLVSRAVDGPSSRRSRVRTSVQHSPNLRADNPTNRARGETLLSVIGPYGSEEIAKAVSERWRVDSRSVMPRMAYGQALAAATGRMAWHDFAAVLGASLRQFELIHHEQMLSLKRREPAAVSPADSSNKEARR